MDNRELAGELVKLAKSLTSREEGKMKDGNEMKSKTASSREAADDEPYASLVVNRNSIDFRVTPSGSTGRQPYGNNAPKAIRYVLDLVKKYGVKDSNVEIIVGR